MKQNFNLFLLLITLTLIDTVLNTNQESNKATKKVAIIGSGIGGTSAAYYLLKEDNSIQVDLFEKDTRVGGRAYSEVIENVVMDIGASFFIKENQLIYTMIKDLEVPHQKAIYDAEPIAFFRDRDITFKSTGWKYIDLIKLVWKYGLSPFRMAFSLQKNLNNFLKIYEILSSRQSLTNLDDLLTSIQLKHLLHMTVEEFMRKENVSQSYIDDIVSGMIGGIYNQHKEINAFAGFITLAGVNYTPYKITGGNNVLVQKIVDRLNKTYSSSGRDDAGNKARFALRFNSVTEILKNDEKFTLSSEGEHLGEYDYVIIACPLMKSNIRFTNITIAEHDKMPNKFQSNHKTIIYGDINPEYFRDQVAYDKHFKYSLISVNKTKSFNVSEFMAVKAKNGTLYHIQSDEKLHLDELLDKGFIKGDSKIVFEYHWDYAYPQLVTVEENVSLPSFKLGENLYHINAIELAGSCMEMSMISARNIVNILSKELEGSNMHMNDKVQIDL